MSPGDHHEACICRAFARPSRCSVRQGSLEHDEALSPDTLREEGHFVPGVRETDFGVRTNSLIPVSRMHLGPAGYAYSWHVFIRKILKCSGRGRSWPLSYPIVFGVASSSSAREAVLVSGETCGRFIDWLADWLLDR